MALKAFLDSLDGVDENLQALYLKQGDGRYKLDADGVEDVSGLKSALDKEREDRRKAREELAKFRDVDPAKYKELLERQRELDEKTLLEEGEVEKIVENRVTSMRKKYEDEATTLRSESTAMKGRLENLLIDSEVQREALPLVIETGIDDVVRRARDVFKLDPNGHAVPMSGEKVIYGEDGVTPLTIKEWLAGLAKTAPHLFKGSQGGGAGNGGGRGTGSGLSAELAKLPPAERLKIVRRQQGAQK